MHGDGVQERVLMASSISLYRGDTGQFLGEVAYGSSHIRAMREKAAKSMKTIPEKIEFLLETGAKIADDATLHAVEGVEGECRMFAFDLEALLQAASPTRPLLPEPRLVEQRKMEYVENNPSDEVLRALYHLKHRFEHKRGTVESYSRVFQHMRDRHGQCIGLQDVVVNAFEVACKHRAHHLDVCVRELLVLKEKFEANKSEHEEVYESVPEVLDGLASVPLRAHPDEGDSTPRTLLDVVLGRSSRESVMRWVRETQTVELDKIAQDISAIEAKHVRLRTQLAQEEDHDFSPTFTPALDKGRVLEQSINRCAVVLGAVSKDCDTLQRAIENAEQNGSEGLDVVSSFEQKEKQHAQLINDLRELERVARSTFREVARGYGDVSELVQRKLKRVLEIGVELARAQNEVRMCQHTLDVKVNARVEKMKFWAELPEHYVRALAEVDRRHRFRAQLTMEVEALNRLLGDARAEENAKRAQFLRDHGPKIPADAVPGLREQVPPIAVLDPAYDRSLPPPLSNSVLRASGEGVFMLLNLGEGQDDAAAEAVREAEELRERLRAAEAQLHEAHEQEKQRLDELRVSLEVARLERDDVATQLQTLMARSEEAASAHVKEISQLRRGREEMEADLQRDLIAAVKQRDEARREKDEALRQLHVKSMTQSTALSDMERRYNDACAMAARVPGLEEELEARRAECRTLESKKAETQRSLDHWAAAAAASEEKVQQRELRIAELQGQLESSRTQSGRGDQLKQDIRILRAELAQKEQELRGRAREQVALRERLDAMTKDARSNALEALNRVEEAKRLRTELDQCVGHSGVLQQRISGLEERLQAAEDEAREANSQLIDYTTRVRQCLGSVGVDLEEHNGELELAFGVLRSMRPRSQSGLASTTIGRAHVALEGFKVGDIVVLRASKSNRLLACSRSSIPYFVERRFEALWEEQLEGRSMDIMLAEITAIDLHEEGRDDPYKVKEVTRENHGLYYTMAVQKSNVV